MTGYDGRDPIRPRGNRFVKNRMNGKIFGVCAGISDYFGFDVMMVRIVFVAAALLGFGSSILLYLAIALVAD